MMSPRQWTEPNTLDGVETIPSHKRLRVWNIEMNQRLISNWGVQGDVSKHNMKNRPQCVLKWKREHALSHRCKSISGGECLKQHSAFFSGRGLVVLVHCQPVQWLAPALSHSSKLGWAKHSCFSELIQNICWEAKQQAPEAKTDRPGGSVCLSPLF